MKSFVALLVISSVAFMALSQSTITGCSSSVTTATQVGWPSTWPNAALLANLCTNCTAGFYFTTPVATGTCVACATTGCAICFNATSCAAAAPGYVLSAVPSATNAVNTVLSCTSAATNGLVTGGTDANAVSCTFAGGAATAVVVSGCASGYGLSATFTCIALATASTTPVIAASPGCLTATLGTGVWQCTSCATGYFLVTASGTFAVKQCVPIYISTATSTTYVEQAGNTLGLTAGTTPDLTSAANSATSNCYAFAVPSAITTSAPNTWTWTWTAASFCNCGWSLGGFWPQDAATTPDAGAAITALPAGPPNLQTANLNCVGGLIDTTAASAADILCTACATGYNLVGTVTGGALPALATTTSPWVCSAMPTNCSAVTFLTNTCIACIAGNNLAAGACTACTATTTVGCSGGCPTGTALNLAGNCATTTLTNCYLFNSTATTPFCILCNAGFNTQVSTCTACPKNCNICTLNSMQQTNCTSSGCAQNFVFSSAAGTCNAAAPATSNTTSGSNVVALGLAFISMIFYYVL